MIFSLIKPRFSVDRLSNAAIEGIKWFALFILSVLKVLNGLLYSSCLFL